MGRVGEFGWEGECLMSDFKDSAILGFIIFQSISMGMDEWHIVEEKDAT